VLGRLRGEDDLVAYALGFFAVSGRPWQAWMPKPNIAFAECDDGRDDLRAV
jgi:hypothetical protein